MQYHDLRTLYKDKALLNDIMVKTEFLDSAYTKKIPIRQRLFHYNSGLFSLVLCKTCGTQKVGWSEKNQRYSVYCGSKCAHSDPVVLQKTANTCLERFGETTNLKSSVTKEKIKQTCSNRYGTDNYAKTEMFLTASRGTSLKKYGVNNPSKSQAVKDKINSTHQERYGRKRQSQSHIQEHIISLKNDADLMRDLHLHQQVPIYKIAEMLGVNHSQLCVHFKENLGIEPNTGYQKSLAESEILSFIKGLGFEAESGNRNIIAPKELDIFIPEKNLAFELDGVAWHTELRGKSKNYHLNKTLSCRDKGVRLVHIYDTEWVSKKEIVKSRIRALLGRTETVYGRKCTIKRLNSEEYTKFFQDSHIQGSVPAQVSYGLIFEGDLVAAMSFGKARYNTSCQWELLRFSNKLNTRVVGGAGKLFKHFITAHEPQSVVSYCDLRWNTGIVYQNIGFDFKTETQPNYWYTKDCRKLESRVKFQKHKLKTILKDFDPNLTEWENMIRNGYDRIWDCGNGVYIWTPDT